MARSKTKPSAALMDQVLSEASWLSSHAQALTDYGRQEEAAAEWGRAADCEEQAACLLEADGQEAEAAIHRIGAAACCERIGRHARAATLLRAALPAVSPDAYRAQVERQRAHALREAKKELERTFARRTRKRSPAVS